MMKSNANPMHKAHSDPRCHAKAKITGNRCKSPAQHGWQVCRMHGAYGGAPYGEANGAWLHGARSLGADQSRRNVVALAQLARDCIQTLSA